MGLRDWVAATATVATTATLAAPNLPTVARVASVAVATSTNDELHAAATSEQAAELHELVAIVTAGWPEADRAETLAVALADPEAALPSYRLLAAELRAPPVCQYPAGAYTTAPLAGRDPADDRRTCRDCVNLSPGGRCLTAWRGERIANAGRDYLPMPELPRRCEGYAPHPGESDQRFGRERWPHLIPAAPTMARRYARDFDKWVDRTAGGTAGVR